MMRNYDYDHLVELDKKHYLHPFTDHAAMWDEGGTRIITEAKGCYLTDIHNNKILDAMAGLWCVNIGYGREEMADVAYQQVKELCYYNSFFKTAHPSVIELSKTLSNLLYDGLNTIFYSSSGSEANDTVLRIVRRYWQLRHKNNKMHVISRHNAYHGSTVAGLSLGGMAGMHEQTPFMVSGIHHIDQPFYYKNSHEGEEQTAFFERMANQLEEKILELGADNVGAFIGEPVQGAGGVIVPSKEYWQHIAHICQKYDILLVADEVICGFGRMGVWFGHQYYDIKPDIITMAKGITSGYVPLSAVAIHDDIAHVLQHGGDEFAHGYTYSGHPLATAMARKNIAIIQDEGLVEKVADDTGPYLQQSLQTLTSYQCVAETRGVGLLGAIELRGNKPTKHGDIGIYARDCLYENHCIIRAVGDSLVMSPPLSINRDDIDVMIHHLHNVLTTLDERYG